MTSCVRCGHELGIGRFCLNCGHPIGQPAPVEAPRPEQGASGRPVWLPWAIGTLLVAILLVILASCVGSDDPDDDAATETARTAPAEQAEQAGTLRVVDLTPTVKVAAPPAAPATTDLDGELVPYGSRRMLDATPATAWRTAGDASGETITFTLAGPSTIRRVGLINGYAKLVPSGAGLVDWYPNNRRITAVEWVFDDGTEVRHDLSEKPGLQRLTIDPVTTSTVRLRLLGVTAPGPGLLGRDYTAISDVLIAGGPAA